MSNITEKLGYYGVYISDVSLGNIVHRYIAYLKNFINIDYWMIDGITNLLGMTDKGLGNRNYTTIYISGICAH